MQPGYDLQMAAKGYARENANIAGSFNLAREDAFIAGAQWARAKDDASMHKIGEAQIGYGGESVPLFLRSDLRLGPIDYVSLTPPPTFRSRVIDWIRKRFY